MIFLSLDLLFSAVFCEIGALNTCANHPVLYLPYMCFVLNQTVCSAASHVLGMALSTPLALPGSGCFEACLAGHLRQQVCFTLSRCWCIRALSNLQRKHVLETVCQGLFAYLELPRNHWRDLLIPFLTLPRVCPNSYKTDFHWGPASYYRH